MKKLTEKKIKYFLKDEKKATKEYYSYGLPRLARDEAKHAKFFKAKLKGK